MLIAIVLLKGLVEVAALALVGQGVLYVLAGERREQNFFYNLLKLIASPAHKLARWITPTRVSDAYIGWAALFLCLGLWIGLTLEKASICAAAPGDRLCAQGSSDPARSGSPAP